MVALRRMAQEWLAAHPGYQAGPHRVQHATGATMVKGRAQWPGL